MNPEIDTMSQFAQFAEEHLNHDHCILGNNHYIFYDAHYSGGQEGCLTTPTGKDEMW